MIKSILERITPENIRSAKIVSIILIGLIAFYAIIFSGQKEKNGNR